MTIVHFVILNLPEEVRYEDHNMIQVCIPPGPNKATDLNSFLGPVMKELNDLCKEGIIIRTDSGDVMLKTHLLFVGGIFQRWRKWQDMQAINTIMVVDFAQYEGYIKIIE